MVGPGFVYFYVGGTLISGAPLPLVFNAPIPRAVVRTLCCNVAFLACLIRLLSAFNLILSGSNLTALRSNSNPYLRLVI